MLKATEEPAAPSALQRPFRPGRRVIAPPLGTGKAWGTGPVAHADVMAPARSQGWHLNELTLNSAQLALRQILKRPSLLMGGDDREASRRPPGTERCASTTKYLRVSRPTLAMKASAGVGTRATSSPSSNAWCNGVGQHASGLRFRMRPATS